MSFVMLADLCVKADCPSLVYTLGVACSSRERWEIGSSDSSACTYAYHVAWSSRCMSPPLPGHLIMQISLETHSLHSATQAGELPNNPDPDLNANGSLTSKCSVPTAYVSLELITVVTGEKVFFWLEGAMRVFLGINGFLRTPDLRSFQLCHSSGWQGSV